jgi:DNA polymerase-1
VPATGSSAPLLVVDGDSLLHRAFHALPPIAGEGGRPVNALLGLLNMLFTVWDAERPRAVAVALDSREPGERSALWPGYQAQRDAFEPAIVEQLDGAAELLGAFGIPAPKVPRHEADDVLATLATLEEDAGGTAIVLTSDRDAYQLVSRAVTVLRPAGGVRDLERVDVAGVRERYGVEPRQVPDLIALRGDPSDNIPGARGIGQKTAAELLGSYGDLEGVIAAAISFPPARRLAILDPAERLRDFRRIATMVRDLPVERPPDHEPDWAAGAERCRQLGLVRLAERLEERVAT